MSGSLIDGNVQHSIYGMRRTAIARDYKEIAHINEVIAEFPEKHPMYKKYGIRTMKRTTIDDGRCCYSISGDTYNGKEKFNFSVGTRTSKKPNVVVANFLKDLAEMRNFELPKEMRSIFNVAKHVI